MAGYGYIRRRGKTHRGKASRNVQVDLGRDPSTGRRRRRVFTVGGTKKDAQHALTAALRERDLGNDTDAGTLTVAEYLRHWLRDGAAQRVAPSTLERYRQIVEQHLVPALGGHRLRELRPQHIDAAYAGFRRRDGRGSELSPKTVFEHHAVLRAALNRAVKKGLLARNPVQRVDAPRPGRREMRVLTAEEAQRLLAAAAGTRYHAILYMALATGARTGELLALRWQDVDLERGTMQITRTARFFKAEGIVYGQPKTARSRRRVALSPDQVAVLRECRRRQLEDRLRAGPAYQDSDLVFGDGVGRPIYDSSVRRAFYGFAAAAGLEHLRLHDLRHTAATLMLLAAVNPKVVSERLGHATVSITLDLYSHVLPDMQREAAAVLDELLSAGVKLASSGGPGGPP